MRAMHSSTWRAEGAAAFDQRRVELRAKVEAAYGLLLTEPEGAAAELLAIAEQAHPRVSKRSMIRGRLRGHGC